MYLRRHLRNDPLQLNLSPTEQKVAAALEDNPQQPVTPTSLEMSHDAVRSAVRKLRAKGFMIDAVYRHGAYFWDGTSKG